MRWLAVGMTAVAGMTAAVVGGAPAQAASTCTGTVFKTVVVRNYSTGVRMGKLEGYRKQTSSTSILYCFKVTRDLAYVSNFGSEIDFVTDGKNNQIPAKGTGNPLSASRTISHCSSCGNHSYSYQAYIVSTRSGPWGISDYITVS